MRAGCPDVLVQPLQASCSGKGFHRKLRKEWNLSLVLCRHVGCQPNMGARVCVTMWHTAFTVKRKQAVTRNNLTHSEPITQKTGMSSS